MKRTARIYWNLLTGSRRSALVTGCVTLLVGWAVWSAVADVVDLIRYLV